MLAAGHAGAARVPPGGGADLSTPAFPRLVDVVLAQQNEREEARRREALDVLLCSLCGARLNGQNSGGRCSYGRGCRKRSAS